MWRGRAIEGWRVGGVECRIEGWRDGGVECRIEGWRDGGVECWIEGWRDGGLEGRRCGMPDKRGWKEEWVEGWRGSVLALQPGSGAVTGCDRVFGRGAAVNRLDRPWGFSCCLKWV